MIDFKIYKTEYCPSCRVMEAKLKTMGLKGVAVNCSEKKEMQYLRKLLKKENKEDFSSFPIIAWMKDGQIDRLTSGVV